MLQASGAHPQLVGTCVSATSAGLRPRAMSASRPRVLISPLGSSGMTSTTVPVRLPTWRAPAPAESCIMPVAARAAQTTAVRHWKQLRRCCHAPVRLHATRLEED